MTSASAQSPAASPVFTSSASTPLSVSVPLRVPVAYLEARAAELLNLDARGQGELRGSECNYLELSDLRLQPAPLTVAGEVVPAYDLRPGTTQGKGERGGAESLNGRLPESGRAADTGPAALLLDVAVQAHGGARVFGRCRGPGPIEGRVLVALEPRASEQGGAVIFATSSAEFRGNDGSESLLTGPSRILADTLLVPRLQDLRVDVSGALGEIDALIEQFAGARPDGRSSLASGGRLEAVTAADPGLVVELAFAVSNAPGAAGRGRSHEVRGAPPALSADERAAMETLEDALDGFVTLIVRELAPRLPARDEQLALLALLIDLRTELATLLLEDGRAEAGDDPLRRLFLESWERLAAIIGSVPADHNDDDYSLRMASFLAAGDALRLVDDLGPAFGIEITRDGLLRLARMLLAGKTPSALTPLPTAEDSTLQALFGFTAASAVPDAPRPPVAWYQRLSPVPRAQAQDPEPALLLREIFPRRDNLDLYLGVVARLIDETLDSHWEESRLTAEQRDLFEPLVRATAWKETCWRHYLPADEGVTVIRSGVGAVGMMQIVGRVWRSLFDLERLEADVAYNVAAGIDILDHYFVDYAVRRGEDDHPGGPDNLVRATYAAYNGGPSKLSRYRRADAPTRARAVDDQFYRQYIVMRGEPWPTQSRCYVRG